MKVKICFHVSKITFWIQKSEGLKENDGMLTILSPLPILVKESTVCKNSFFLSPKFC